VVIKAAGVKKERKRSQNANLNPKISARSVEKRNTRVEYQNIQSTRTKRGKRVEILQIILLINYILGVKRILVREKLDRY